MKGFLLVMLLLDVTLLAKICGCDAVGKKNSSQCALHGGIKWYDVQAVFDALDPCTPNPCRKGQVCLINEDTYQHYCQVCNATTTTGRKDVCGHKSSFESLLLMCYTGFYRALPWLRQLPNEKFNIPTKKENVTCMQDACVSNPCQNGGTCFSNKATGGYKCECTAPKAGKSCEAAFEMSEKNRIATGSKASQSVDQSGFPATNALDNNPDTFSHTVIGGTKPWWQVDLQASFKIYAIHLANRKGAGWRLHDFEVRIGNNSMSENNVGKLPNSLCHFHAGLMEDGQTLDIYCEPGAIVGRYLTIQIVKDCNPVYNSDCKQYKDILSLAIVRVYGQKSV